MRDIFGVSEREPRKVFVGEGEEEKPVGTHDVTFDGWSNKVGQTKLINCEMTLIRTKCNPVRNTKLYAFGFVTLYTP